MRAGLGPFVVPTEAGGSPAQLSVEPILEGARYLYAEAAVRLAGAPVLQGGIAAS